MGVPQPQQSVMMGGISVSRCLVAEHILQAQPVPTKEKEDEYWAKHAELLSHGLLTTLRVYAEKVTEEVHPGNIQPDSPEPAAWVVMCMFSMNWPHAAQ